MKKYITLTLKKQIPLFVISLILFVFSFLMIVSSMKISNYFNGAGSPMHSIGYLSNSGENILNVLRTPLALLIPIAYISAYGSNTYRYSLSASDTFNQVGFDKRRNRYVNNLTTLVVLLTSFTIAYLFLVIVLLARFIPVMNLEHLPETTKVPFVYNFWYLIPAYLLSIFLGTLNYFFGYFLTTRANTPFGSWIMIVFGYFISLCWGLTLHAIYIKYFDNYSISILSSQALYSIQMSEYWVSYCLLDGITGASNINVTLNSYPKSLDAVNIILIISSILVAVACIFAFVFEKESSGEIAGKLERRDIFQPLIFHLWLSIFFFWSINLTNSLFVLVESNFISYILLIIYAAIYYVLISVFRRDFKPRKEDFIIIGANVVFNLVGIILSSFY